MKLRYISLFLLVVLFTSTRAQELNCQIDVNYNQVQNSASKQIFEQMKRSIFEFMNNTKWSSEVYGLNEKIECSILITIENELIANEEYSGKIQITCSRPVYKSGYTTQIFNFEDDDFQFKFQQFSQLEFNINSFQNNLTSVLAFYAYVILATDNDSFSLFGGTQYWQKAQIIVNNAQTASEKGWKSNVSNGKQINRYWLIENTLQPIFKGVRECMYEYCRNGMDNMYANSDEARAKILKTLELLPPIAQSRPASVVMQAFFNSKRDEIINIFKGALPEEKTKVKEILVKADPAGTTRYEKITSDR